VTAYNEQTLIEDLISSLAPTSRESARQLFYGWSKNIADLNTSTGNTPAGNTSNILAPPAPSLTVTGANGAFSWSVTPPANVQGTVYYEISYSSLKSFVSSSLTVLPKTNATAGTINLPDQALFFRVRCTLNGSVWSDYALAAQSAIDSGLLASDAAAPAASLAQTNYGTVTSQDVGGTAVVNIQGAGGALTSMVAVRGGNETILPAGAVSNVALGTNKFVAYSKKTGYLLQPTLAAALADHLTPIGKVSVVEGGIPTLPTVSLVLGAGGAVIAWNVTSQGNGLTGPVTLLINTTTGSGATPGDQNIVNGKLISIAPGNPGHLYGGTDTVTVSGGVGPGTPGGGTSAGGNGGRMTNV
jgi:hypothetical protein